MANIIFGGVIGQVGDKGHKGRIAREGAMINGHRQGSLIAAIASRRNPSRAVLHAVLLMRTLRLAIAKGRRGQPDILVGPV